MPSLLRRLLAAIVTCAASLNGWCQDTIKIGVLHSLSGTMAISEAVLKDTVLMAIDEINAKGGLLGKKLEPIVVDPASNWPLFAEKTRQLISKDKVAVIFGCWTSVSRKSVLGVVEELNGLLFYPVQYEGEELSKNVFYTGAVPNQQAIPAVEYLMSRDGGSVKRFVLLGTDFLYPRTTNRILRSFLRSKGLREEEILEEYTPFGHSDYQAVVDRIKRFSYSGNKTAIISTLSGDSNLSFYRELDNEGPKATDVPVLALSIGEEELRGVDAKPLVGHLAVWNYFMSIKNPTNDAFIKKWSSYARAKGIAGHKDKPLTSEPMEATYIGINMWAQAVTKAKSTDTDKVIAAMAGQTFKAPSGFISTMDARNHHLHKPVFIGEIKSDGQLNVIWKTQGPVKAQPWSPYIPENKGRNDEPERSTSSGFGGRGGSGGSSNDRPNADVMADALPPSVPPPLFNAPRTNSVPDPTVPAAPKPAILKFGPKKGPTIVVDNKAPGEHRAQGDAAGSQAVVVAIVDSSAGSSGHKGAPPSGSESGQPAGQSNSASAQLAAASKWGPAKAAGDCLAALQRLKGSGRNADFTIPSDNAAKLAEMDFASMCLTDAVDVRIADRVGRLHSRSGVLCTVTLISINTALTARHCLLNLAKSPAGGTPSMRIKGEPTFISTLRVEFGPIGKGRQSKILGLSMFTGSEWQDIPLTEGSINKPLKSRDHARSDLIAIKLEPIDPTVDVRPMQVAQASEGDKLFLVGFYPGYNLSRRESDTGLRQQKAGFCQVVQAGPGRCVVHGCSTNKGSSGAAIFVERQDPSGRMRLDLAGVHVAGGFAEHYCEVPDAFRNVLNLGIQIKEGELNSLR